MRRQVLLPVLVMCTIAGFLCFEWHCIYNELNILQEKSGITAISWFSLLLTQYQALEAHPCAICPRRASLLCFVQ
jgi:hypothetical protein